MRLVTTILASALTAGITLAGITTFGCSSEDDGTGGTGGGTGATGGKGGTGGGGSGGTGAAGTGGTSGIACDSPEGVTECKRLASTGSTIACTALTNCGCENCTCQLQECENDPLCVAVRECVIRTKCCATTDPTNCPAGAPDCLDADAGTSACSAEVTAAGASVSKALALGQCIATERQAGNADCAYCP